MAKPPLSDAPQVEIDSTQALRDWLATNHAQSKGIWNVTRKKADAARHVPHSDVVDAALCWGWVECLLRAKNAARAMLYLSPGKAGSNWSRVNMDRVARLEAVGCMAEPGRVAVARARADGSWDALDDVEAPVVSADLAAAFETAPGRRAVWGGWPRSVRQGALEPLLNARRPATRSAGVATIPEAPTTGVRPVQWRKT